MKLRKLHIENYKMFKDFDISFVDKDNNALPIIVLAGVNGSGKTTLLESFLKKPLNTQSLLWKSLFNKFSNTPSFENVFYFKSEYYDNEKFNYTVFVDEIEKLDTSKIPNEYLQEHLSIYIKKTYTQNIEYLEFNLNKIEDIKEIIRQKYIDRAFEIDKPSKALKELQDYIKDIFNGLDLTFNLSTINYNKKEVFFKDNNGVEFDIDELSTGEKTLLSKVLYLFFKDYKDKVILIDEPELSLHPSWQNKVLKIYENFAIKNNCQIIIATHSPHIIGSAKNEYIRILRKKEDGTIEAIDNLKAHGRDINSILFDVMGEVAYRPREFDDKIDRLHIAIDDRNLEEAKKRLKELKKDYGEEDEVIMEAQMLIDMFSRDE